MGKSEARTTVRRLCYAALPLAAILIVPGFSLMPNRHHAGSVLDAEPTFQLGFFMALAGVVLAAVAMLVLVLGAEE